jgi:glycosyltransferase involved in cell wall biosynthesis
MRLLVLSDNFVPEQNAPALRTYEHCKRWVEDGIAVTVITSVPNFPTGIPQAPYRNRLYQREVIDGIEVIRVWTFMAANRGVALRMIDFASFGVTSFLAGLFQKADVIMATSPQLLTAFSGHLLARVKRIPWVFEVRDLWPDSIIDVGAMREGFVIRLLGRLEKAFYKSAARIVALTEPMRARIAESVSAEKIAVVPNGANFSRLVPRERDEAFAAHWALEGKFVVGYVGTHGLAQGLKVMVHAASILRETDVHFLFVGEGARRQAQIDLAAQLNLHNVRFIGMVAAHEAPDYLALSDAVVVPLKKLAISEAALPSKIFEAAAMERPILLGVGGIAADLIRKYDAGLVFEPEGPRSLADAIMQLRDDPALRARLREGCRALARDYDRKNLADRMLAEIRSVIAAK